MYGPRMEATLDRDKNNRPIELVLGPIEDEGSAAAILSGFVSDNRVRAFMIMSYPITASAESDWIQRNNTDESAVRWAIYADGQLAGMIGLELIDRGNRHAELGIMIGSRHHWGKGIATATELIVLEYAFGNIVAGGLNKVHARVLGENIPSSKALQKAGFVEIGVRRQEIWRNGCWHDLRLSEVLQADWQPTRNERFKAAGLTQFRPYPGCEDIGLVL